MKSKALKTKEERVAESSNKILCLLNEYNVNATFFRVGELAEKHPETVENIRENNHEIPLRARIGYIEKYSIIVGSNF